MFVCCYISVFASVHISSHKWSVEILFIEYDFILFFHIIAIFHIIDFFIIAFKRKCKLR